LADEPRGAFGVVRPRLLLEVTCLARREELCVRLFEVELRLLPPTGLRRLASGEPERGCWLVDARLSFLERRLACFPSSSSRVMVDCRYERAALSRERVVSALPEEDRPWRLLVAVGFVERRSLLIVFCCCIVACGNLAADRENIESGGSRDVARAVP
jgi:hypothetical protein